MVQQCASTKMVSQHSFILCQESVSQNDIKVCSQAGNKTGNMRVETVYMQVDSDSTKTLLVWPLASSSEASVG